ncbi:hypothetical protein TWF225_005700 [Orbilia oligospora]|nr:hypothetical protein TWF225_005700 [Orbilia oligospora]KAF3244908.1 hypothetical protein TWF128_009616 [Orbilia oligospora]KAF3253878.1 hypothetical protein TWF217_007347 [Orbilia oligospora]
MTIQSELRRRSRCTTQRSRLDLDETKREETVLIGRMPCQAFFGLRNLWPQQLEQLSSSSVSSTIPPSVLQMLYYATYSWADCD